MGYMRHHAIICTSWEEEHLNKAYEKAKEIFNSISSITDYGINGYKSFLIPPDGSKEFWPDSDTGDKNREKFKQFLKNEDLYIDWLEVQYGDDERVTKIIDHNDFEQDENN